jgi:hypothetical protein
MTFAYCMPAGSWTGSEAMVRGSAPAGPYAGRPSPEHAARTTGDVTATSAPPNVGKKPLRKFRRDADFTRRRVAHNP